MRCYIAGPMSGLPDLNFPAFHATAKKLRDLGHDVVNPAEINPDHTMPWGECMRKDIAALVALTTGATQPRNEEHFDLMAHALGVSCIRAGQIGGPEVDSNPMLPPLVDGNNALRQVLNRRRTWGKWQVLPAEADTLRYAVDLYETILLASSPQQMATAVDLRMQALKGQTMETLEETQK